MEINDFDKNLNRRLLTEIVLIIAIFVFVVLLWLLAKNVNLFLTIVLTSLEGGLLLLLFFIIWMNTRLLQQRAELKFKMEENDNKRKYEEEQSKLNQSYRMESLKWEISYQTAKLLTKETKSKEEDKEKKVTINIPAAKDLISAIKEIRNQLDKDESEKTK